MLFVFYFLSGSEVGGGQESEGNDVMIALPPHLNRSAISPNKKGNCYRSAQTFSPSCMIHYRNVVSPLGLIKKSWIS